MVKKEEKKPTKTKYYQALGRRKTAIARVRLMSGSGRVTVNDKELKEYFREPGLEQVVLSPIENLKLGAKFDVNVKVKGGGIRAQSEAVRQGLSRALTIFNAEFKKRLRNLGFLTRDSRMVERKKYGLKKARRAPQWQKR